jgi:two-component system, chemotaxis family, CheB/CheR fusion protein
MTAKNKDKQATTPPSAPAGMAAEGSAMAATPANFPIVGIGASAGGLAAFEAFFQVCRRI